MKATNSTSGFELEKTTLAELGKGQTALIARIQGDREASSRFTELGFTPGETVQVLRTALFGDPIQIEVRGVRYALRKSDAAKISVALFSS